MPDPSLPCAKCGQVHNPLYCRAHSRNGRQCTHRPAPGQKVCWLHGAKSPQAEAKAARALDLAKARQVANTYGLPRDVDPTDALLEEIARTAGHIDFLSTVIRSLSPDTLVWGVAGGTATSETKVGTEKGESVNVKTSGTSLTESAGVNVWLTLYHQERKHLVDVCKAAIGAGIAERTVRLAEAQGSLMADILRSLINDPELGLEAERKEVAFRVAARHLRSLAA